METNELNKSNPQQEPKISGWLAFFLWVGVGLGAVVGFIRTISDMINVGWTPYAIVIYAGYLGALLAVAVMTIIAFYKRSSNAVALAMTYIAIIAFDGVMQLAIMVINDDMSEMKGMIRSFIWAAVWLTYLVCSEQVKQLIPAESRSWKMPEKILLVVYIVSCIALVKGVDSMINDPLNNNMLTKRHLIQSTIDNMNKEFPTYSDGIRVDGVTLEDSRVVYNYTFLNNTVDEFSMDYLDKYKIAQQQDLLHDCAEEIDPDINNMYRLFFGNGYDLSYDYKDKNGQLVFSITLTPDEYNRAVELGSDFRCDKAAWEAIITAVNADLPMQYMGDAQLNAVHTDFDANELVYEVQLSKVEPVILKMALTESYLTDYVVENKEDLRDYIWTMAALDKMTIRYQFLTSEGKEHATIRLPYESYKEE